MKKTTLIFLLFSFIVLSCNNEPVSSVNNLPTNSKDGTVINGRFYYTSKETLKQAINELKLLDDNDLENKFEKLYNQGFRSHSPIVNPSNESLISKLDAEYKTNENYEKKSLSIKTSTVNYEEDNSIGDPYFGAVVNKNNEIIVGDSLYKITKDLGVLSVKVKDSTHLYTYLQDQINNLTVCDLKDTSRFQSLFGINKSCINYFDSKHRIKTEFWNQKWLIYTSVGVQVRTQVKRIWIWWASDADEIHMGINRVYLKFKFPDPEINSELYLNTYYTNTEIPVYMYKGEFKILKDNYNNYISPTFIKANTSLPFFDFKKGTDMLNIYIRKLPFLNDYNIRSESNIKQLYKLGTDFLKKNFNSGVNNEFVVSYQKNTEEVEVLYFGERYKSANDNDLKRTFYRDTEFVIGATYNPDGGTSINGNTGNPNGSFKYTLGPPKHSYFRNYTDYELDFYGLARKGSTWSGNRVQGK